MYQECVMPSPADDYLAAALAFMEQHSLHRDLIDWPTLRHTATQHAADAATPADTYDAIRWALTQLQDRQVSLRRQTIM
jgi:carboxyl-terminal processing protease